MRFAKVRERDIANGPGIRTSIWVCGCTHHCDNCFNEELWNFNTGKPLTKRNMQTFAKLGNHKDICGYSILGGEPLQQGKDMLTFVSLLKEVPDKTIWMWTGYVYEELSEQQKEIVSMVDVLVDGKYIESLKCPNKRFKGSSNQRIIDIPATLKKGHIVLSYFND